MTTPASATLISLRAGHDVQSTRPALRIIPPAKRTQWRRSAGSRPFALAALTLGRPGSPIHPIRPATTAATSSTVTDLRKAVGTPIFPLTGEPEPRATSGVLNELVKADVGDVSGNRPSTPPVRRMGARHGPAVMPRGHQGLYQVQRRQLR